VRVLAVEAADAALDLAAAERQPVRQRGGLKDRLLEARALLVYGDRGPGAEVGVDLRRQPDFHLAQVKAVFRSARFPLAFEPADPVAQVADAVRGVGVIEVEVQHHGHVEVNALDPLRLGHQHRG